MAPMNRIVGIDLGTTNSLVATVESGIPLVIADSEGRRLTPSVVHFPGPGFAPIVGHAANRLRAGKLEAALRESACRTRVRHAPVGPSTRSQFACSPPIQMGKG